MKGANNSYWGNIAEATRSLLEGLRLTWRHLRAAGTRRKPLGPEQAAYFEQDKGIFTTTYPHESLPVPDTARHRLHNEIDDCIVCDKCAKICPVNCIEIEPVRATEEIGKTSDGTSKRIYAAKFDIDMGKCCFCGLCTTVCPTECLTMTKAYDFSEFDVADHTYAFAEMTPEEILQRKEAWETHQAQKLAAKPAGARPTGAKPTGAIPARPKAATPKTVKKPAAPEEAPPEAAGEAEKKPAAAKPIYKPKVPVRKKPEGDAGADARAKALELMKKKQENKAQEEQPPKKDKGNPPEGGEK